MKKRLLVSALSLLTTICLYSQEGQIFYYDYGSEGLSHEFLSQNTIGQYLGDTALEIDLDGDSITDLFYIGYEVPYQDYLPNVSYGALQPQWPHQYSDAYNWYCHFLKKDGSYFDSYGDTISNIQEFENELDAPKWYGGRDFEWVFGCFEGDVNRPNSPYLAFRIPKDGGYCYGWIEHSIEFTEHTCPPCCCTGWDYYHEGTVTLYRWAYCNIPNYPLRVGQTSFNWDVAENAAEPFAAVHPNPTTGQVTITGQYLKSAEVFNTLGQRVATATGEGDNLSVDLSGQPAGVYFVNVTDKEGRKCVRKVVKE